MLVRCSSLSITPPLLPPPLTNEQTRTIELPSDSTFAVAMRSRQEAERAEQQRIKSLVLNYDLGDAEHDGTSSSFLLQPNMNHARPLRKVRLHLAHKPALPPVRTASLDTFLVPERGGGTKNETKSSPLAVKSSSTVSPKFMKTWTAKTSPNSRSPPHSHSHSPSNNKNTHLQSRSPGLSDRHEHTHNASLRPPNHANAKQDKEKSGHKAAQRSRKLQLSDVDW
jgi:Up-frameshift suppressor 2